MKTCARCGKNVSDGTSICPNCSAVSFHTETGFEGGLSQILIDLVGKNKTAGWILITIFSIVAIALIIFCISFFGQVM